MDRDEGGCVDGLDADVVKEDEEEKRKTGKQQQFTS